ncbi:protein SMG9 [Phthorimaea operculella]|nr:protein SMG9 [Phthorimaea operculella]
MADKKKKVFGSKDTTTPRRPVILKSDRETSKEPSKEKQEVQPTFILKTREQSTPKEERANEPTLKTPSDGDGPQISKIAQNENKEKKTEQKTVPPVKPMTEPVKLLTENLEFNTAALEFLQDASTNYLVIGIVGTQGVGKSTILNLVAQNKLPPDLCDQILRSHEMPDQPYDGEIGIENQMENLDLVRPQEEKGTDSILKFKVQDIEQIERGVHCTKGVDMYVTNDRVILLDCQALWSISLIDESNANPHTARSGNVVTVDCLQIASFLMAVCHVLIATQDWFTDYHFIRCIQAAEMLKPSLSASNSSVAQENPESSNTGECHPHLLLLHNRCQLEDFTPESIRVMQDLYRKAFQKSNLQLNSGMYMYSDSNKNGLNVDAVCKGYSIDKCGAPINLFLLPEIYHDHVDNKNGLNVDSVCKGYSIDKCGAPINLFLLPEIYHDHVCKGYSIDKCGAPINLFLLPEIYHDHDNREIYRGHPSFAQLAARLRWMLLGVNRHQITSTPNLSERGWFHYSSKAWETIRKCTFFLEYERFLP